MRTVLSICRVMIWVILTITMLMQALAVFGFYRTEALYAGGVKVTSLSAVNTENGTLSPAETAGIMKDDIILSIDGASVETNQDVKQAIENSAGNTLSVRIRRNDLIYTVSVSPAKVKNGNTYEVGLETTPYVPEKSFNPVWLIIASVLMIGAVIAFFAMKHKKLIPLLIAVACAILFIILALTLMDKIVVAEGSYQKVGGGYTTGITLGRAISRHMSPALIPLFMLPVFFDYRADISAKKKAEEEARTPTILE